ncbi:hypothetical protein GCM10010156_25520 [Planobispora rosea]|uniref:Uncharacterized protein n=1 Tax=Planobispora rosea TaxID=35762 RepID=A0A8J3S7Q3_PLARO|nr:hypothetical protein [Planobispora rosea]GGS65484.1 hypothetical protein GCM10010156_25520 [Planobispora rosea]GIH84913.1 hypothetical protein Pro02_33210 [Planobispora rosea]
MLRLHDAVRRRAEPVVPEGARSLRLYAFGPPAGHRLHLGDLRSFLLADLVGRLAGRRRVRVLTCHVTDGEAFADDLPALNVRPPDRSLPVDEAMALLSGSAPGVTEPGTPPGLIVLDPGVPGTARWTGSGRLSFEGRELLPGQDGSGSVRLRDVAEADLDPLAVRLALLGHRYREDAELTWDALRAADGTLRLWRSRVATWSEAPSAPMPADRVAAIEGALDDDLATPLALRLMDELERDESLAPGSRFEAFLHLDQILALALPSEIGRPPAG